MGCSQVIEVPRRVSQRTRKSAIPNDFLLYLHEEGCDDDPLTFDQAINCNKAEFWQESMREEMDLMSRNSVWKLVEPNANIKPIGCKWVFKTKRDSNGNIERYKSRLVAKGFTQVEEVDYTDTFSPMLSKDLLRIVLSLVVHYDLELHQMDVKTAFLNGELQEDIYMHQPLGFIEEGKEGMVCKLEKSIYGLKQASRHWFLKFDEKVTSFGFIENKVDDCIYIKVCGSRFIFLVLYVNNILLASNDMNLLKETKELLTKTFDMKDLGEASFVLGIKITRDRKMKLLGLSQRSFIDKVLKRFNMQGCSKGEVPMGKGDRLNKDQCPKNNMERENMQNKLYASLVGSLMYIQVCTRPDIAFSISVLGRFQSNPREQHWVTAKKVMRYLQRTKTYKLVYKRVDKLELFGYMDSDFAGCQDDRKSTSGYIFFLA